MKNDRQMVRLILRNHLASFIHRCFQTVVPGAAFSLNWHILAMAWHLSQCFHGTIKRLIITIPPRSLKSISASVAFPSWILGRNPASNIICISYSANLASKHSRDCRAVMESAWYREVFPKTRIHPEKNTEMEFMTTAQGHRMSTSTGGTLTGRGGNFLILDDPMNPDEAASEAKCEAKKQWYDNTLYSRLDNKNEGVIIIIMQRLHIDDLVGYVLQKENWVHLNLPAFAPKLEKIPIGEDEFHERIEREPLHPERENRKTLEKIKSNLGTYAFSAQYLQNPIPLEGNLIRWEWFRSFRMPPERGPHDRVIQSWDTASKATELNDFSVCTTWLIQRKDFYLIDVVRERYEFPRLRKMVVELAQKHDANAVLIEEAGSGIPLVQELRREGEIRPIGITPEGDKTTRMSAQSAKIEAGYVYLPESASWLQDFQAEVLQFPHGKFDDQIDSMSQFLNWAHRREPRLIVSGGTRIFTP